MITWPVGCCDARWDWVDNWRPRHSSRAERRHGRHGRNFRKKYGARFARALALLNTQYVHDRLEERSFMSQIFDVKKLPTAIEVMGQAIEETSE